MERVVASHLEPVAYVSMPTMSQCISQISGATKTEHFYLSRLGLTCMPNLKLKLTKISYTLKNFKEDNEDENVE